MTSKHKDVATLLAGKYFMREVGLPICVLYRDSRGETLGARVAETYDVFVEAVLDALRHGGFTRLIPVERGP